MIINLPRINISVDDSQGAEAQGDLNILYLGFGIHQAWIYTAMYGASAIFMESSSEHFFQPHSLISYSFLISSLVLVLTLLFTSITDQKLLRHYTSKRLLLWASALTSVGTLIVFLNPISGALGLATSLFAGTATGIGSALLLQFWSTAFSRHDAPVIVLNAVVAIIVAAAIYSIAIHVFPLPFFGVFTACLPLLELPFLWQLTPVSYAIRHTIPIFNPLPIHKGPFCLRLVLPMLLFGFALGTLRSLSTQVVLPSVDPIALLLALGSGGTIVTLLLVATFSPNKSSYWESLFRFLVPLVAIALFFLPSLASSNYLVGAFVIALSYICFEAFMWSFFGELSQEFRLSPIFVFGFGRGCLSLGALAGALAMADPAFLSSLTPFGETGIAVIIMLAMVLAHSLLPRRRAIRHLLARNESYFDAMENFNDQAEQVLSVSCNAAADTSDNSDVEAEPSPLPQSEMPLSTDVAAAETPSTSTHALYEEERAYRKSFRTRCEIIANRYLLSRRETEVLFLLARGHNAAYIQDKLCISKSTAKSHISHIYRKMDIHSQQELLSSIEELSD